MYVVKLSLTKQIKRQTNELGICGIEIEHFTKKSCLLIPVQDHGGS